MSSIPINAQSVNFREIRMGKIAPNILFRSSHPIKDNRQEKSISLLAANAEIAAIINLCDTMSGIIGKSIYAPWYNKLFSKGQVIALGMDFSCSSPGFRKKLKEALQFLIHTGGPWLIHCHAGIDRTGFVSMVLESFMGASLDEIINDYLLSFNSIFKSSVNNSTQKTDEDTAMQILSLMSDSQAINAQNLQHIAENYLRSKVGLSAQEVKLLKEKLSQGI